MAAPALRTDHTRRSLPIAETSQVWGHLRAIARSHRRALLIVVMWHALAALAALVGPWVVGQMVQVVSAQFSGGASGGMTRADATHRVTVLAGVLAAGLLAQTVLIWIARRASFIVSEEIFAELREGFLDDAVRLPLSVVERAGTGDLVARTSSDIDAISRVVRRGIPAILVAATTLVAMVAAAIVTSPLAALVLLSAPLIQFLPTRRYLSKARDGYLWERATYAGIAGTAAETVEGARTVDALDVGAERGLAFERSLDDAWEAERYTLGLRLRWFPWLEIGFFTPVALAIVWGGWLAWHDLATIGAVTAVTLYVQQSLDPLGELISWLDEIQVAGTSFARILGIKDVPPDREASGETPRSNVLEARDVHYSYRVGRDVLGGVSLALRPGERLAIVGPSGAGKSTLGRLIAGIDGPRTGTVTVGDVPLVDLPLPTLRGEVALVTQEHHVFVGTLGDNIRLPRPEATDDDVWAALAAVDADEWARALPQGLDTNVGSGGHALTVAQAQQLSLARLVLADPHTLVLDEATSLLDPRAARHLERSLAAVVEGRTVVAIAHRLHTAHDADRVCVVEAGQISELGSHEELVAANGAYAALWRAWHDETPAGAQPGKHQPNG